MLLSKQSNVTVTIKTLQFSFGLVCVHSVDPFHSRW